MDDRRVLRVQVFQRVQQLQEPGDDLLFIEAEPRLDDLGHGIAVHVVDNGIDFRTHLDEVVDLGQVLVVEVLQDVRLAPLVDVPHVVVLDLLDDDLFLEVHVPGGVHQAGRALTDGIEHLIGVMDQVSPFQHIGLPLQPSARSSARSNFTSTNPAFPAG